MTNPTTCADCARLEDAGEDAYCSAACEEADCPVGPLYVLAAKAVGVDNLGELTPNTPAHDCYDHAVPYESNGALGHGFDCGVCGKFLQAG